MSLLAYTLCTGSQNQICGSDSRREALMLAVHRHFSGIAPPGNGRSRSWGGNWEHRAERLLSFGSSWCDWEGWGGFVRF